MPLICPAVSCRSENELAADFCRCCNTPLRSYARLLTYPALLFNRGLAAARTGQFEGARDYFAAVVHWCPLDIEARNALALACYGLGDREGARRHWEEVLRRAKDNPVATSGLRAVDTTVSVPAGRPKGIRPKGDRNARRRK